MPGASGSLRVRLTGSPRDRVSLTLGLSLKAGASRYTATTTSRSTGNSYSGGIKGLFAADAVGVAVTSSSRTS
eukprot:3616534-Rhodomonas_salina.3